ncbi:AEC family transporter [Pyruvatibacter sp.]|uniref:AEC family transporter n=1 Tax=Pyruvatibacter sp. TaxID=1981328 RepID=UPI0032EC7376
MMDVAYTLVLPVFGVVVVGYVAARMGWFSHSATQGLDTFVFTFAIPALLFRALANTDLPDVLPWGLWGSYYGGILIVWAIGSAFAVYVLRRPMKDAIVIGFGGGFSNTVMLGIPIILTAFGEEASVPLFLILAFHGLTVFTICTFLLETAHAAERHDGGSRPKPRLILLDSLKGMARNPLIWALGCGVIFGQTGLTLPVPVDGVLEKLGQAGIPCALFAMGATLARYEIRRSIGAASQIAVIKLGLHPLIVFLLGTYVFALPVMWLKVATVMAAVPSGVYTFIMASRYAAAPGAASSAVVLTTALSLLTLSAVLTWAMSF